MLFSSLQGNASFQNEEIKSAIIIFLSEMYGETHKCFLLFIFLDVEPLFSCPVDAFMTGEDWRPNN